MVIAQIVYDSVTDNEAATCAQKLMEKLDEEGGEGLELTPFCKRPKLYVVSPNLCKKVGGEYQYPSRKLGYSCLC